MLPLKKKNHGDCGQEIIACKEQEKNKKHFAINTWTTLFKATSFQAAFASIAVMKKH